MGRRQRRWTEELIQERERLGFGQGTGRGYRPWLMYLDFSSRGTMTRMYVHELGRTALTFSNLELTALLYALRKKGFKDANEQKPVPRERSVDIAHRLGVTHPVYFGTNVTAVVTLDCVCHYELDGKTWVDVYDSAYSHIMDKQRRQELKLINETYCKEEGWNHFWTGETTFSKNLLRSLEWIRMALPLEGEEPQELPGMFDLWPSRLHKHLLALSTRPRTASLPVYEACIAFEEEHQLPTATGLRLLKLLMWNRYVDFDLAARRPWFLPLTSLEVRSDLDIEVLRVPKTPSDWLAMDHTMQ
jgi:hypothetical protein